MATLTLAPPLTETTAFGRAAVGLEVDQAVDAGVGTLLLATVRNALPLSFKVFSSHKLQI
jgi:hypothetical protein